jgi:hypothetical protein
MLYYNHVNMVTKDHILGKAWEAQLAMFVDAFPTPSGIQMWVQTKNNERIRSRGMLLGS